jgi:DHA2 family multidrug resistance protein
VAFPFGFIFVPLSTITFATLEPRLRTEATAMFSLMRNIGSSIGISIVVTLLAQNTQVNHASLAARVTPYRAALQTPSVAAFWDITEASGLGMLNGEITRQAATIAYLNDFTLMMYVTLLALPLLLLLRVPRAQA